MSKMNQPAYVAVPMSVGQPVSQDSRSENRSACGSVAKFGIFAAVLGLLMVGAMHHFGCAQSKPQHLRAKQYDPAVGWHHRPHGDDRGGIPGPHRIPSHGVHRPHPTGKKVSEHEKVVVGRDHHMSPMMGDPNSHMMKHKHNGPPMHEKPVEASFSASYSEDIEEAEALIEAIETEIEGGFDVEEERIQVPGDGN